MIYMARIGQNAAVSGANPQPPRNQNGKGIAGETAIQVAARKCQLAGMSGFHFYVMRVIWHVIFQVMPHFVNSTQLQQW